MAEQRGALSISAVYRIMAGHGRHSEVEDQWMTAYVLVIMLAAGGHHQPLAVGYPDQGSCLVAAERLRRNKAHVECLKFVQGK
jgi:hypothetical protein